jgi:hypothetical protein
LLSAFLIVALLWGAYLAPGAPRAAVWAADPPTPTPAPPPRVRVDMEIIHPPSGIVSIGGDVTFLITVRNVGVVPIVFLWLMDQYPPDCLAYVSAQPSATDDGNGRVIWSSLRPSSGYLQPGQYLTAQITFRVVAECPNMVNQVFANGWSILDQPTLPTYDTIPIRVVPPSLYCLCPWPDYAPAGMPDFGQWQNNWQNPRTGQMTFSGPVAAANALWWLDSEFESGLTSPARLSDRFPLVQSYDAQWDDHDPRNVPPLVEDLANRADTDGQRSGGMRAGTDIAALRDGLQAYIGDKGLAESFAMRIADAPDVVWIKEAAYRGDGLILQLGFWENQQGAWKRLGGHFVTVACAPYPTDPAPILELSDPYQDRAEQGWPGKYAPAVPHGHPGTPPDGVHNDAGIYSWDLYNLTPATLPQGKWSVQNYVASSAEAIAPYLGQNESAALQAYRATEYRGGQIVTMIEYALQVELKITPPVCPRPTPAPTPTASPVPPANARAVTLQQGKDGYRGVQDTCINAWFPDLNYSRASLIPIRSGGISAPLLRFDLSQIPANATVARAKLVVDAVSGGFYEEDVSVYELLIPWGVDQATWKLAGRGKAWALPGANGVGQDRAEYATDTELAIAATWLELDVTALVQKWVRDPASNYGVILKGSSDISVQHNIASSEYWEIARRPRLTFMYWVAP